MKKLSVKEVEPSETNEADYLTEFDKLFNDTDLINLDTQEELKSFLSSSIERARWEERANIVKMLWSIHVNEKDEELKSYNRALDRAIFKLQEKYEKI